MEKEVDRLWTECGQAGVVHGGKPGKKRRKGRRGGKTAKYQKNRRDFHGIIDIVEKNFRVFHKQLIPGEKVWYNRDMEEKIPDLAGYLGQIAADNRFSAFRELLLSYNQKVNLTAIEDPEEILYKHFLDSAAGEFLFPHGARVIEVGSGAGFPSLPVRLLREDLSFTLVESVGKKCAFLAEAIRFLGLGGVTALPRRAEELAREEEYREKFDVACARAVARMNTLAEYCLPFVRTGGRMIAYKGALSAAEEELKEAERAIALLGGKTENVVSFPLPGGRGERTLISVRKIGRTPEKYPRGRGKERKEPIV